MSKLIALSSLPVSAALISSGLPECSVVTMIIGAIAAFPMVLPKRIPIRIRK